MSKANPFLKARLRRGWKTAHEAARNIPGIRPQQLKNLEGAGATRETDPADVHVRTMVALLETYWPDLALEDFLRGSQLKIIRRRRLAKPNRR